MKRKKVYKKGTVIYSSSSHLVPQLNRFDAKIGLIVFHLYNEWWSFLPAVMANYPFSFSCFLVVNNSKLMISDHNSVFRFSQKQAYCTLSCSKNCCYNNCKCLFNIDNAPSFYQLKFKESFYIAQLKPKLDKQVHCVSLAVHLNLKFCFHYRVFFCNIIG